MCIRDRPYTYICMEQHMVKYMLEIFNMHQSNKQHQQQQTYKKALLLSNKLQKGPTPLKTDPSEAPLKSTTTIDSFDTAIISPLETMKSNSPLSPSESTMAQRFLGILTTMNNYLWEDSKRANITSSLFVPSRFLFGLRVMFLLLHIWIYAWNVWLSKSFIYHFQYLTCWGYMGAFAFFLTAVIQHIRFFSQQEDRVNTSSKNSLLANIIFEASFSIQFPIVFIWWVVLNPMPEVQAIMDSNPPLRVFNVFVHALSFACLWIDMAFNTVRFVRRHFIIISVVLILYSCVNAALCYTQECPYPIINWTDFLSYIFSAATLLLAFLHFYVGVYVFEYVKLPRMITRRDFVVEESLVTSSAGVRGNQSHGSGIILDQEKQSTKGTEGKTNNNQLQAFYCILDITVFSLQSERLACLSIRRTDIYVYLQISLIGIYSEIQQRHGSSMLISRTHIQSNWHSSMIRQIALRICSLQLSLIHI
eukprot:TRINITY_DN7820_c0_g1_i7.p1 TRINITY_DN7820_c0_g1~~TRINITY_DN7820_c0_g1_i7.p1  ORF type:complete len:517 (+),score=79.96 TRINITY_DN7820_c0_g1_i7:125-1552(+)